MLDSFVSSFHMDECVCRLPPYMILTNNHQWHNPRIHSGFISGNTYIRPLITNVHSAHGQRRYAVFPIQSLSWGLQFTVVPRIRRAGDSRSVTNERYHGIRQNFDSGSYWNCYWFPGVRFQQFFEYLDVWFRWRCGEIEGVNWRLFKGGGKGRMISKFLLLEANLIADMSVYSVTVKVLQPNWDDSIPRTKNCLGSSSYFCSWLDPNKPTLSDINRLIWLQARQFTVSLWRSYNQIGMIEASEWTIVWVVPAIPVPH